MKLKLDISHKSLNKHREELCGDYVGTWKTENSTILVLADGMGSGVNDCKNTADLSDKTDGVFDFHDFADLRQRRNIHCRF